MNDNDRRIVGVAMYGHAMVHTYELSIPIFITIWMAEFAASAATIGLVVGAGYALYGFGALPGGVLTDAYGSRGPIALCLFGMGCSFLVLAFVDGLVGLAVALALWGIAASVYHPSGLRLISTGVTERGTGFAYHGIAGNLGIALGPLAATLLLVALDWRVVVGLLALPALVGAVAVRRAPLRETAAVDRERSDAAYADGGVASPSELWTASRALFLGGFALVFPIIALEGLFYRGVLTFLPDLLADLPGLATTTVAGHSMEPSRYVYVGLLTIGMAGQYAGGKLSDRAPPERALVGAFLALAIVALAFVPAMDGGLLALVAVSALLGLVLFGEQPLLQATVADYSAADVRGLSYGYMFVAAFGVGALGAATSGAILTYATGRVLFLALAGVAALAALLSAALVVRG